EALRGVSFEIAEGEVFGLLGPNGAGKTTTVEILEGYRRRDGGDVAVLGSDPARGERAFRERIGVVLQQSQMFQNLTVRELHAMLDRKSTRLNSSHRTISYAVFCLKKKRQLSQPAQLSGIRRSPWRHMPKHQHGLLKRGRLPS